MGYRLQHLLHSSTEGFLLKLSLVFCLVLLPATLLAQWVKTNGPYGGYIYSLAARGDTHFAATNSGVFRSTDGGRYWLPVDRGLTRYDIRHLGLFEGMLYAATQKEPYRSSNYGESWEVMDSRLFSDTQLNDFAALGSSLFIVGSGEADGKCVGGLWRSSD